MGQELALSRLAGGRVVKFAMAAAATALSGGIVLVAATGVDAKPTETGEHKVTLCHATDSYTNPYVEITIDYDAIVKQGHDGHEGPVFYAESPKHEKWGDIIPAFNFGGDAVYAGMNMSAAGKAILANGCAVPTPTTTTTAPGATTTTLAVTTTTGAVSPTTLVNTTTTTAAPATTTTAAPATTTTAAPATTTTAAENTTTTDAVAGVTLLPTTTAGPGATPTTAGAVAGATLVNGRPASGSLPVTGSNTLLLVGTALVLSASGAGLLWLRRMRTV